MIDEKVIWRGSPVEIRFREVNYMLTNQRVIVDSGLILQKRKQIELLNIKNIEVCQGLKDNLLNRGQIKITSTYGIEVLENVDRPFRIAEMIRTAMKEEKLERVDYREIV